MQKSDINQIKRRVGNAIKDLERTDYIDICVLIKSNTAKSHMISETPRGTFVNLDQLSEELLRQLDNMINTKLQRISER